MMNPAIEDDDNPPELVDVAALPDSGKLDSQSQSTLEHPGFNRVPITLVTGRGQNNPAAAVSI